MKVRFRVEHFESDREKSTQLIISINCTANEMNDICNDMNTIPNDGEPNATDELIEAVNIMAGRKDFVYETKDKN
jgi:hypothetical protein